MGEILLVCILGMGAIGMASKCKEESLTSRNVDTIRMHCAAIHDKQELNLNGWYEVYCNANGSINEAAITGVSNTRNHE